jgi:hypothetical protein
MTISPWIPVYRIPDPAHPLVIKVASKIINKKNFFIFSSLSSVALAQGDLFTHLLVD